MSFLLSGMMNSLTSMSGFDLAIFALPIILTVVLTAWVNNTISSRNSKRDAELSHAAFKATINQSLGTVEKNISVMQSELYSMRKDMSDIHVKLGLLWQKLKMD